MGSAVGGGMMMKTIQSRSDLVTYLANAGGLDSVEVELVACAILADDHPAWGRDWTDYLYGIDLALVATGGRFAAIGDGVVWGLGLSPERARQDAAVWLAEADCADEADALDIVAVDVDRVARIEAGDVSA